MNIIRLILAIAFLILVLCLPSRSQTNGTNGIEKPSPAIDSVMKLINEKILINKSLIDSAWKRIGIVMQPEKERLTVKEWEQYFDAFAIFERALMLAWLEENRKKKK